jgi:hypothetical protein
MRTLVLKDHEVIVDDDVVALVAGRRWVIHNKVPRHSRVYFATHVRVPHPHQVILHRMIAGAPAGLVVDHRNGNTLDNRRENLRICETRLNVANAVKKGIPASSAFKGVSWCEHHQAWLGELRLTVGGRRTYPLKKRFTSEVEAALAYDDAARRTYGEFACVNFPKPGERSCVTGEVFHGA